MNVAVQDAFNEQIKNELFPVIYTSPCRLISIEKSPGFAVWMRLQAQEELAHAMRLFDYVLRRGGQVELRGIEAPATDFGAPLSLFESVLEHEQAVTVMIHGLFELSGKAGDWRRSKNSSGSSPSRSRRRTVPRRLSTRCVWPAKTRPLC